MGEELALAVILGTGILLELARGALTGAAGGVAFVRMGADALPVLETGFGTPESGSERAMRREEELEDWATSDMMAFSSRIIGPFFCIFKYFLFFNQNGRLGAQEPNRPSRNGKPGPPQSFCDSRPETRR